jgi:hypothetical protein
VSSLIRDKPVRFFKLSFFVAAMALLLKLPYKRFSLMG